MGSPSPSLGASTAWAASLFEHSPIGQGLVDPEGRWIRVNPALARMLDREPHDLVGMTAFEVTHPDDRAMSLEWGERMLAGEIDDYRIEKRYVRPDGTIVWVRATSALVRDPLGRPRYAVVQLEDITQQRTEQRFLEAILDHADTFIIVLDTDGRVVRFNPACEAATGWRSDEVLGTPFWDLLIPAADVDSLRARFGRADVEGDPLRVEAHLVTHDGSALLVSWSTTALRDERGDVSHVVATGVDITERRAAERELARSERRHRAIVERASDLITVLDDQGVLAYASPAAERLLGKRPQDLVGTPALDHVHPADRDVAAVELLEAMQSTQPGVPTALRLLAADGTPVAVEALATNLLDDDVVAGLVVTLRDVRDREELDRRFRSAFDAAPIGMALVGLDGTYLDVNAALCEIVGYEADALLTMRFRDITHAEDLEAGAGLMDRLLTGRLSKYRIEKRYVRADGDIVWVQLSVCLVQTPDGEPAYFISQVEDITDRKSRSDGLAYQAHHDSLTGLLNRHATMRRLEGALTRRHVADVAVLFADLDGFKDVNDTHGHAVGDEVLRTVASRVLGALRPGDVAGRIGGDEFVVVLEGADRTRADAVADRLARAVATPVAVPGGGWVQVHASVGVAVATLDDVEATELLARADRAMYAVKGLGR